MPDQMTRSERRQARENALRDGREEWMAAARAERHVDDVDDPAWVSRLAAGFAFAGMGEDGPQNV